jgi:hypothetical protein
MLSKLTLVDTVRPGSRVYGPYLRKDGRKHVVIRCPAGQSRTVSYPKWLMEQKLGRELDPDLETVDHVDGNFLNNSTENFQILPLPRITS